MEKKEEKIIRLPGYEQDFVEIDAYLGEPKRIYVIKDVEVLFAPRNPLEMEVMLFVDYEKSKESIEIDFFPRETLFMGWVRCYTDDAHPGFLCNRRVVAAIGLETFLDGDIEIPSAEEADRLIRELDIPYPLIPYAEAVATRGDVLPEWMKRWKKSGKLCEVRTVWGEWYEIESGIPENRRDEIVKSARQVAEEARKDDQGR